MKNKANEINHYRFFFPPLTLSEHQTKAKTQSQSYYVLVAVRGRLLHADQGKELLTTSNVFTVCLLLIANTHKEKKTHTKKKHLTRTC